MTITFKKPSKKIIALLTMGIAIATVMIGTFAWNSFNQSRINVFNEVVIPDVNLHDDFEGGPNKDVYVENSGQKDIFVRVRLTEYLETVAKGSLVLGHLRGNDDNEAEMARTWAPHNGDSASELCKLIEPEIISPEWAITENFHTYYTWFMGGKDTPNGQIYYLPATDAEKGEQDENGVVTREPVVVANPLTGTSPLGDAHLEYKAEIERLTADGTMTEKQAMEELGIKKTLTSFVITMTQWAEGGYINSDGQTAKEYELGDFWIIDEEDGWCYWASPLKSGEATGLLLDKVERTNVAFDSNSEYCINAWLQAIDFDESEMIRLVDNGGISDNGNRLMQLAGGSAFIDTEGAVYKYNKITGAFTMTYDEEGFAVEDAAPFVPLGSADVNSGQKLSVGDRFSIDELVWDGEEYENYTDWKDDAKGGLYNITKFEKEDVVADGLKLLGTEVGRDGTVYLKVAVVTNDVVDDGNPFYIASISATTTGDVTTYAQAYPGTGPFGYIYPAPSSTIIGTSNDLRSDPSITIANRYFYHVGNGVYVEVGASGAKGTIDGNTKFYFAGSILSKTKVSGIDEEELDEKMAELFPLILTEDVSTFGMKTVTTGISPTKTSVTEYDLTKETYKFTGIETGLNGQLYIRISGSGDHGLDEGYISIGSDKYLGNEGDLRVWAGSGGTIGTNNDKTEMPSDFTETFLKSAGITKSSMLSEPGDSFEADGIKWVLLTVDDYGNRLFTTEATQGNSGYGSNTTYSSSTLATTMKTFYNSKMSSVKPYVQDVFVPELDLYSRSLPSKTAPTAFALSKSEVEAYIKGKGDIALSGGDFWTKTASGSNVLIVTEDGATTTATAVATSKAYRPAIWVKFSDADSIANVRDGALSFLSKNFTGEDGQTFIADGVEWLVLDKDASGNLLILATQSVNTINQGKVEGYMAPTNNLRNWINNTYYTGKMATLRNYVKLSNANTAIESGTTNNQARNDAVAHSKVITSGEGLYVFVLSQSEYNKYATKLIGKSPLNIVWTRSTGGTAETFTFVTGENAVNNTLNFSFSGNTNARQVCPAMWVNFGSLN